MNRISKILFPLLCLVSFAGCGSEFAKWDFAAALLEAEVGDRAAAIPRLRTAVAAANNDPGLTLELARQLSLEADPESVQLCDQVLADHADRLTVDQRKNVWRLKNQCQQEIGDFAGALVTYKDLLRDHVERNDDELNGLAYHRALAGTDLLLAAENIDKAIQIRQFNSNWEQGNSLTLHAKSVIANALVARYLDQQRNAADDDSVGPGQRSETSHSDATLSGLSQQIEKYESAIAKLDELAFVAQRMQSQETFATDSAAQEAVGLVGTNQELIETNLSFLLTVRALLHQEQEKPEACNRDRYRVAQLKHDSNELIRQLPTLNQCLDLQKYASMYLDTQGTVQGLLPWQQKKPTDVTSSYRDAIENLTLAIDAMRLHRAAWDSPLVNSAELSVVDVHQRQLEFKRMEAVLLYHRLLTHQRDGGKQAMEAAASDRAAIMKLGFKPGSRLF